MNRVLNIIENAFNPHDTRSYHLSVVISYDRLFMLIYNEVKQPLVQRTFLLNSNREQSNYWEAIEKTILSDTTLTSFYKTTKTAVISQKSTLVPAELYTAANARLHLTQTNAVASTDHFYVDRLSTINAMNVYAIDEKMEVVLNLIPNNHVVHNGTALIEGISKHYADTVTDAVFVNVYQSNLQIIVFKDKEFQLYNSYQYATNDEFLYFVLLQYQQFEFKSDQTTLYIIGNLIPPAAVYDKIRTYIRNVEFIERTNDYIFSEKFDKLPKHSFFDLYSLAICE